MSAVIGTQKKKEVRPQFSVTVDGEPAAENVTMMPIIMRHPIGGGRRYVDNTKFMVEYHAWGWEVEGDKTIGEIYEEALKDQNYVKAVAYKNNLIQRNMQAQAQKNRAIAQARAEAKAEMKNTVAKAEADAQANLGISNQTIGEEPKAPKAKKGDK